MNNTNFTSRILELSTYENGWIDGINGEPIPIEQLEWACDFINKFYPLHFPTPHIFAGMDGGISLQWKLGDNRPSLDINTENKTAYYHNLNLETKDSSELDINLENIDEWIKFVEEFGKIVN